MSDEDIVDVKDESEERDDDVFSLSEEEEETSDMPKSSSLSYHGRKAREDTTFRRVAGLLAQSLGEKVAGSPEWTFDRRKSMSEHAEEPIAETVAAHAVASVISPKFRRIVFTDEDLDVTRESGGAAVLLTEALALRRKYVWEPLVAYTKVEDDVRILWSPPLPFEEDPTAKADGGVHAVTLKDGVFEVRVVETGTPLFQARPLSVYYRDVSQLGRIVANPEAKSFAYRRLQLFQARFRLHGVLNANEEKAIQQTVPHRDFYNVRKVDTHIHHSASMNQKHLLRFIKKKLKTEPDNVVIHRDGHDLTLAQVFESLNLTAYSLSVDTLDVHADQNTFHRFDRFNLKYNPVGESRLREIFLKTDNLINGRYLAELTHELFDDLEMSKYQFAEYRLSIYGRSMNDWSKLAAWVCDHNLFHENVRWMIQIPRLWHVYKTAATPGLDSFADLVTNIFQPLFDVSIDPSIDPKLHRFLQAVVGFDCVDDESKPEHKFARRFPPPREWTSRKNPPYTYWTFYLQQNLASLNVLRTKRGLSTFTYRPHCGEAGDHDHMLAAFLCGNGINHGIELRKIPALEYLFYLEQIGLAMSPLSNNALFIDYHKNPFHKYFERGLNVSLSTDDPLQFHYTREPLIEEYAIAAQVWKLSTVDQMEIARNSVIQSGFEHHFKKQWLGSYTRLPAAAGNDIHKTNIPGMRVQFRYEQLLREFQLLHSLLHADQHWSRDLAIPPAYKTLLTRRVEDLASKEQ